MKPEHIIDNITIDVKKQFYVIHDNGKDIPEQKIEFDEPDEWNCVRNREGEAVLDCHIHWDEFWQFQYVGLTTDIDVTTGKEVIVNDGDYRNPDTIGFVGGDSSKPYDEPVKLPDTESQYEFRAVMEDGEDGVQSLPLEAVNVGEIHDVIAIGLYQNMPDGTQQHVIDIEWSQIKKWNGVFMGFRYKKD